MLVKVMNGLIYDFTPDHKEKRHLSCHEADRIAQANGMDYAESFVKKFDKKGVISLDPNTLEIQNNAQKFISNIERG